MFKLKYFKENDGYAIYFEDYPILAIEENTLYYPNLEEVTDTENLHSSHNLHSHLSFEDALFPIKSFLSSLCKRDLEYYKDPPKKKVIFFSRHTLPTSEENFISFYFYGLLVSSSFFKVFANQLIQQKEELEHE